MDIVEASKQISKLKYKIDELKSQFNRYIDRGLKAYIKVLREINTSSYTLYHQIDIDNFLIDPDDWDIVLNTVEVRLYDAYTGETSEIEFPLEYITNPETLEEFRNKHLENAEKIKHEREKVKEEKERAEYERLKERFG